jgi:hypothetical protein
MILGNILGLIGLVSILFLILIYILKPKYEQRKVSSTYIWKLSLKYRKQRIPFDWLRKNLLLLIQLIALLILAFMLAEPLVNIRADSGEKIIILESSASMLAEKDGKTRFDRAMPQINSLIDAATATESVTVIIAGKTAYCIARREKEAAFVKQTLIQEKCGYGSADLEGALQLAAEVKKENTSAEIIVFTSRDYEESSNVTLKNMSQGEWNASILDFTVAFKDGHNVFGATVASYNRDCTLVLSLYIDERPVASRVVDFRNNEEVTLEFDADFEKQLKYKFARLAFSEESTRDDFRYDNEFYIFGGDREKFKVQLISDTPFFLRLALSATNKNTLVEIPTNDDPKNPPKQYEGFDLYIFDGFLPPVMPMDGAVWILNPPNGSALLNVDGGDADRLTFGASYAVPSHTTLLRVESENPSNLNKATMAYITPSAITLSSYTQITHLGGFEPLMTCGSDPVVLVKNQWGVNITVFAFSKHNSNLPNSMYLMLLANNICDYSLKYTTSEFVYDAGS